MTHLKKSIAALALSLPLAASAQQAAPAAAPAPLYQIYGTLNLNTQYIEVSKPTTGNNQTGRLALSTDSSNVGIRGTAETSVPGYGVVYQCETSANLDGEGPSGLCNRNSRIGLSAGWGTLFYGNWDSPYKALLYGTKADDPFGNTDVYDAAAIIGSPGSYTRSSGGRSTGGTTANTLASFNQRAGNSIAYHSPKFQGVQVKAQYSMNEFQNRAGTIAPALYSVGLSFDRGPLSAGVGYERHDDYVDFTTGAAAVPTRTTTDQGVKAGAGYELGLPAGTLTVGAQVDWLKYAVAHPANLAFDSTSRFAYLVGVKFRAGDHELRARFMQALDQDVKIKGATPSPNPGKDTGAANYTLGYAYYLSKAAQVYAYATYLDNAKNATYTFATGGPALLTGATPFAAADLFGPGANLFAGGLGMRYAF
jgi:predicted porin